MSRFGKVCLVVAGYGMAFAIASVVVALYVAATDGPDRQASSGMHAFGDSLFFLGIFGVASVPATGAALYFLRPYPRFWSALSRAALGIAATALLAVVVYFAGRTATAASALGMWAALAVLRLLATPLMALGFLLSALFAPGRAARNGLLVDTAIEAAVFGSTVCAWFWSSASN
jgi:hypothetical protein